MRSSEERVMILRMIEEGKISAEDGARLLAAMTEAEDASLTTTTVPAPISQNGNRFLHVRVTDLQTGKRKVSVNIPVTLVSFALRFVPESAGINVDQVRTAIENGYTGTVVDVYDEEDNQHVEVVLE
jgi:hypothetical protein